MGNKEWPLHTMCFRAYCKMDFHLFTFYSSQVEPEKQSFYDIFFSYHSFLCVVIWTGCTVICCRHANKWHLCGTIPTEILCTPKKSVSTLSLMLAESTRNTQFNLKVKGIPNSIRLFSRIFPSSTWNTHYPIQLGYFPVQLDKVSG